MNMGTALGTAEMRKREEKENQEAEEALADMPPFNAHGYTVEVPVMEMERGLDPIQKMQLSRQDRARKALQTYARLNDITPEEMQDFYMAVEMPGGSFNVRRRFVEPEDNRPDSEIAKEKRTTMLEVIEENALRKERTAIDGHRPDSNPKSALGIKKVPLHLVSPISILHEAMAMAEGGMKYGPYNYRIDKVAATVYCAAAMRHIFDWMCGEEMASDSGIHHLGHAKACCGILVDAQATGSLIDDRYKTEAYAELLKMYTEMLPAMAERIAAMSKDLEAHQREQG